MENTTIHYEKAIDLKHLFFAVIRQWRWILAAMLVGAIALAGLGYAAAPGGGSLSLAEENRAEKADAIAAKEAELAERQEFMIAVENGLRDRQYAVQLATESLETIKQAQTVTPEMVIEIISLVKHMGECQDQVDAHVSALNEVQVQISDLQSQVEALKSTLDDTNETVLAGMGFSLVKMAILGAAFGFVCVCGVVFVRYLFDKRLCSTRVLSEQFGIAVLASTHIPAGMEKHRGVDKLLDRLESVKTVDADGEYRLAAAKLQAFAGEHKQVLLTGTLDGETMDAIAQKLWQAMPGTELKAYVAADLPHNPEAIVQLPNSTVLLVEEIGKTKVPAMLPTLELLLQSKADVAGAFVL